MYPHFLYTVVETTTFQYLVSLVLCDKFQTDQQTMDSEMKTQNENIN